jgi:uncharacterized protein
MSRAGTIDGLQFARGRDRISGSIGIDALPRLAATGCDAATLAYRVRGENGGGRLSLTIEISGELRLVCQRCLGALAFPLAARSELELAETESEIEAAEDDIDRVLATKAMDVATLVEDEAILALPMAPLHGRCETGVAPDAAVKAGPFAALAGLRRANGGSNGSSR